MRIRANALTGMAFVAIVAIALVATGCSESRSQRTEDVLEVDALVDTEAAEVSVFYPSGDIIAEETIVVSEEGSYVLAALRELFNAAPKDPSIKVTLPPATVNSVRVVDGVAWIDFDSAVLVTGESDEGQRVALAAIIYTATQFDEIDEVAFTVDGQTSGSVDGKDVANFWGTVTLDAQPWSLTAERTSVEGVQ